MWCARRGGSCRGSISPRLRSIIDLADCELQLSLIQTVQPTHLRPTVRHALRVEVRDARRAAKEAALIGRRASGAAR